MKTLAAPQRPLEKSWTHWTKTVGFLFTCQKCFSPLTSGKKEVRYFHLFKTCDLRSSVGVNIFYDTCGTGDILILFIFTALESRGTPQNQPELSSESLQIFHFAFSVTSSSSDGIVDIAARSHIEGGLSPVNTACGFHFSILFARRYIVCSVNPLNVHLCRDPPTSEGPSLRTSSRLRSTSPPLRRRRRTTSDASHRALCRTTSPPDIITTGRPTRLTALTTTRGIFPEVGSSFTSAHCPPRQSSL